MKIKGDPGPFMTLDEVKQKLVAPAYGAADLADLGLFYTEGYVRSAMASGKLRFQKINKRSVILCRDDILEYWHHYRSTPYEPVNNVLTVKLTISEADTVARIVKQGQNRVDRNFGKDDLFRNIIHYMNKHVCTPESQPHLFVKHY